MGSFFQFSNLCVVYVYNDCHQTNQNHHSEMGRTSHLSDVYDDFLLLAFLFLLCWVWWRWLWQIRWQRIRVKVHFWFVISLSFELSNDRVIRSFSWVVSIRVLTFSIFSSSNTSLVSISEFPINLRYANFSLIVSIAPINRHRSIIPVHGCSDIVLVHYSGSDASIAPMTYIVCLHGWVPEG